MKKHTSNRRTFLKSAGILSGAALLPWQRLMADVWFKPHYEMRPLRKNVGVFTDRGGTIGWLMSDEALVVVDTQFPNSAEKLVGVIKEKTDRKLDILLNTHHHGDHSGGNIAFKDMVTKVVAHKNSKVNQQRVAEERDQVDKQLYPDTTFETHWSESVGGETITATWFGRAHTDGDAVIHFENANVAHMGDLLFNRRHPYVDTTSGANIQSWINVLDAISKKYDKDTLFVFGHAGEGHDITGSQADLKVMQHYLKKVLDFTRAQLKAGKSAEQILQATTIPGAPEFRGPGAERPLRAAVAELAE